MRESFVFHEDYIEDLPDQYKTEFIQATINYGLYGENPPFKDGTLEMALWAKIARRIDAETEKYKAISAKRKEAAQKRYAAKIGESVKTEPPEAKSARFEKPTLEEIAAYCSERKNGIDAQAFFDFYESKGWKVGAVKMRDWRASVRTWEQRHREERHKATGIWGKENQIPEEITDLF